MLTFLVCYFQSDANYRCIHLFMSTHLRISSNGLSVFLWAVKKLSTPPRKLSVITCLELLAS